MTTLTITGSEENYKLEAAAKRPGFSVHTVRFWCRTGRLGSFKFGNRIFVPASAIDRMISQAKLQA